MPAYRFGPDKQIYLPPYRIGNASIFSFMFQGDADCIQRELVDCFLAPNGVVAKGQKPEFELLFDGRFIVNFINQNQLSSMNRLDAAKGIFNYHEATVYLGVKHRPTGKSYWFTPTMHLDSFAPLVAGREIYGIPKALGFFEMPSDITSAPMSFSLAAEVFPSFGSTVPRTPPVLYEVGTSREDESHRGELYEHEAVNFDMKVYFDAVLEHHQRTEDPGVIGIVGKTRDLFELFLVMARPGVFLKQLPAGDGSANAVYQELFQAKFKPASFPRFRFLRDYHATFYDYDSFPLANSLGLVSGDQQKAILGFWMSLGFRTMETSPFP